MRHAAIAVMLALAPWPGFGQGIVSWPDLSRPARAVGGGKHDAAVVVGVENYFAVPEIPGARSNAQRWYEYLAQTRGLPAPNIKLLADEDATREEILDAARKMAGRAAPEGTLWFVFVGHGAPSPDGKDGLLIGVDAQQKAESLAARGIGRRELLQTLAGSRAGAIRVVLDACFSGRGQEGLAIIPDLQPLLTVPVIDAVDPRMVILTAAKGNQFAGALPGASRPAFSYLVLGGLRGWAVQGRRAAVTAGDLVRYATNALEATLHGRDQTPDLLGQEDAVMGVSSGEDGPSLTRIAEATAGARSIEFKARWPEAPKTDRTSLSKSGIEWVTIPGGSFLMGADEAGPYALPRHRVRVKTFQMAKTLVTNRQYQACVRSRACTPAKRFAQSSDDDRPVVGVDWDQAQAFARWVGGRLPSEAEWEYAARSGGKEQEFPWGDSAATCERAVVKEGRDGCGEGSTWPVCSHPQGNTEQGLCDMAGNTEQWVQDRFHDSYNGAPADGSAWESAQDRFQDPLYGITWESPRGGLRVHRGGAWNKDAAYARSAYRSYYFPRDPVDDLGFRPARPVQFQDRGALRHRAAPTATGFKRNLSPD